MGWVWLNQVLFYEQVIPGGVLAAYLDADHWASGRSRPHPILGSTLVNHNEFPAKPSSHVVMVAEKMGLVNCKLEWKRASNVIPLGVPINGCKSGD